MKKKVPYCHHSIIALQLSYIDDYYYYYIHYFDIKCYIFVMMILLQHVNQK